MASSKRDRDRLEDLEIDSIVDDWIADDRSYLVYLNDAELGFPGADRDIEHLALQSNADDDVSDNFM